MTAKIGEAQRHWREQAEKRGWSVKLNQQQHLVFYPPSDAPDRRPVVVPGRQFKDNRGLRNAKAKLRQQGLDLH